MIAARLFDGLTRIIVQRRNQGMDTAWWIEVDCEEDTEGELIPSMNRAMVEVTPTEVAPWPEPICSHAHVDASDRIDQFPLWAGVWDTLTGEIDAIDSSRQVIDPLTPNALAALSSAAIRPVTSGASPEATRAAVQEAAGIGEAAKWVRLPYRNEFGMTDLGAPVWAIWETIPAGGGLTLVVPQAQDHFAPFDLCHPERYRLAIEDLERSDGLKALPLDVQPLDHALLEEGGYYALYLRPRRWRWFVTCIAHYVYVDPLFEWPVDEIFLAVFWDRPPFWPYRHDITYSRRPENYDLLNFYGQPRSWDVGIDSKWRLSRAAAQMAHEMYAQQWWFLCNGYFFTGNEMPDILIESDAPQQHEAVLGIGRIDTATGAETRLWVIQRGNLDAEYPRQVIGQYLAAWYATED